MSSLKDLSMNVIIRQVKDLPPVLRDELIGKTISSLEKNVYSNVMKNIVDNMENMVSDLTHLILKHGDNWTKPTYMEKIDYNLYQVCVNIATANANRIDAEVQKRHIPDRYRYDPDQDSDDAFM